MSALLNAPWLSLYADAALKGFVVLLAALAVTRMMRRASAAARHLVWLSALAATLLLPVAGAVVPAWRALPPPPEVLPGVALVPAPLRTTPPAPAVDDVATAPLRSAPAASVVAGDAAAAAPTAGTATAVIKRGGVVAVPVEPSAASAPAEAASAEPSGFTLSWTQAALLVWMIGFGVLGARLLAGVVAVWRLERTAVELVDERWTALTDRLSRRMGLGRIVRLLRGGPAAVPMTWGAFRPVILLPQEADAWDEDRRAAVLAHELAHVRRWDALTQWIAHLAVALFWFNPLVWTAARRVREEREHACDDAVLAVGTRATDYADHLLTIVRALGSAPGPAAALAMARRTQFEGRLLAILDSATPRGQVTRTLAAATPLFALAVIVPLAALRAAERAPEPGGGLPIQERARSFGSPDRHAEYLLRLVADLALPPMALEEVARSTRELRMDAERAKVLDAVLDRGDLGSTALSLAIGSAAEMRSPARIAAFLRRVAEERPVADGLVCDAFFAALDRLRSADDLLPVLEAVLGQPSLDVAVLEKVIEVAEARRDDASLRIVLSVAVDRQPVVGQARRAYLQAARGLRDPRWRSEALALLAAEDAAQLAPADTTKTRQVVGGDPEWEAQMLVREGLLTYHEEEPDSAAIRVDARNSMMSWRDGASEMDLRAGGHVTFRQMREGAETVAELREDGRGGVVRTFRVAGQVRPWDAEAQRWYEWINQHIYEHLKR